jgi:hypothetical protein
MMTLAFSMDVNAKTIYKFGGGPCRRYLSVHGRRHLHLSPGEGAIKEFRVLAGASGGSVENMRKVDSGAYAMGVVYSGHVYLGRNGMMKNDTKKYENVLGVAYFYGAPAQLVVKKGGGINSVKDLEGKKVGVGNAGSGALPTVSCFSATWVSGTKLNAMPWATTMPPPHSATISWMPSGCSPHSPVVPLSWPPSRTTSP